MISQQWSSFAVIAALLGLMLIFISANLQGKDKGIFNKVGLFLLSTGSVLFFYLQTRHFYNISEHIGVYRSAKDTGVTLEVNRNSTFLLKKKGCLNPITGVWKHHNKTPKITLIFAIDQNPDTVVVDHSAKAIVFPALTSASCEIKPQRLEKERRQ